MKKNKVFTIEDNHYPVSKYGDTGWRRGDYIFSNTIILENLEKLDDPNTQEYLQNIELIRKGRKIHQIDNYLKKIGLIDKIGDARVKTPLGIEFLKEEEKYLGGIYKTNYIILLQLLNIKIKYEDKTYHPFLDLIKKMVTNDYKPKEFKEELINSFTFLDVFKNKIDSFKITNDEEYLCNFKKFIKKNWKGTEPFIKDLLKLFNNNKLTFIEFENIRSNSNKRYNIYFKNELFKNKVLIINDIKVLFKKHLLSRARHNIESEYYDLTKRIFLSTGIFSYEKVEGIYNVNLKKYWHSFFKSNLSELENFNKEHSIFLNKDKFINNYKLNIPNEKNIEPYNFEHIYEKYYKNSILGLFDFIYNRKSFYSNDYIEGISRPLALEFLISLVLFSKLKENNVYKIEDITNIIFSDDYKPLNVATGGKADIEIIKKPENYLYNIELSLMIGRNLNKNEIEPTRAHLIKNKCFFNKEKSFAIFTAKEMENNLNFLGDLKDLHSYDMDTKTKINTFAFKLETWKYIYEKINDFNIVLNEIQKNIEQETFKNSVSIWIKNINEKITKL